MIRVALADQEGGQFYPEYSRDFKMHIFNVSLLTTVHSFDDHLVDRR
jgi:hypothetical protein